MSGAPSNTVDGFEAAGRDEPCPRIGRYAIPRPLFNCGGERIVECLLGSFKVSEKTNQGRKHLARLSLVDRLNHLAHVFDFIFTHLFGLSGLFGLSSLSGFLVHPGLFSSSIESFHEIEQTDRTDQIDQLQFLHDPFRIADQFHVALSVNWFPLYCAACLYGAFPVGDLCAVFGREFLFCHTRNEFQ